VETHPCTSLHARAPLIQQNYSWIKGRASTSQVTSKPIMIRAFIANPAYGLQGHALCHCHQTQKRRCSSSAASKGGQSRNWEKKVLSIEYVICCSAAIWNMRANACNCLVWISCGMIHSKLILVILSSYSGSSLQSLSCLLRRQEPEGPLIVFFGLLWSIKMQNWSQSEQQLFALT
jgi:hypothetical protein